ncbi:hypothetical protein V5279_37200 [Bradyrhizobium sp. 26S5]|nr:hypothetical protein [Bradyrhizobium sp. 2S1]MCK7667079.1 hypothetical protein [Bradyrhizobium sp. 2S1]
MPPIITLKQVKGFSLWVLRAVMSGRGDEVVDLAKTNCRADRDGDSALTLAPGRV